MGGKSTYMRQTALIVLLAHAGSFVPATRAVIGPIDRIFTRIGAADDLAQPVAEIPEQVHGDLPCRGGLKQQEPCRGERWSLPA